MKLMVLILNKTEALEYLLEGLSAAGISGATIIPSSGMAMTLSKMNSSFLSSSIRSMFSGEVDDNKTIISVIENDQLDLVVPADETGYDLETSAILKGCPHPAAAKLWTEYILTEEFGNLGAEHGSYRFPVTEGAALPEEAERMGLDMESTFDYDFEDAKDHASLYVEDFYASLVE